MFERERGPRRVVPFAQDRFETLVLRSKKTDLNGSGRIRAAFALPWV
jgi:hypothetical protein